MASLTTLLHEHQALRQISRVIRDQVDRRHCDIVEVTRLRFEFANMIRAHLASEHRHLLSRLECEDRIRIGAYDEVLKDATDLRLAYSTHVRTWTRQAVQEDWTGFRESLNQLREGLFRHLTFEEQELYRPGFALLS